MEEKKANIKIKHWNYLKIKITNYYELLWTQLNKERFGAIFVENLLWKLET